MAKDINLLPDVTLKEEKEGKQQKLLTIISMAILVIGIFLLIGIFTYEYTVTETYNKLIKDNNERKNIVLSFADAELYQRNIKSKLATSTNILSAAKDFKTVVQNVEDLKPQGGITITDITIDKTNKVGINMASDNSDNFKLYIQNVLDKDKGQKYFTDIALGGVSSTREGGLQYNMSMTVKPNTGESK